MYQIIQIFNNYYIIKSNELKDIKRKYPTTKTIFKSSCITTIRITLNGLNNPNK